MDLAAQGPATVQAGVAIVQVLVNSGMQSDLDSWINTYKLHTTTAQDPTGMTLTDLVRREYCYLVDLATMKIIRVWIGSTTSGLVTSSAKCAMDCAVAMLNGQQCAQTCP
jgi:hypothetical protein